MNDRKKFEIVDDISLSHHTTRSGNKKFEIVNTSFVVPRQTTASGKMTITNKSRPRKCPFCQTNGKITLTDENKFLCKKCGHTF